MLPTLIALIGQIALPPISPAENLDGLPEWLAGRWKCSTVAQRNWEQPGFDDSKWIAPKLIPMLDNGVLEGHNEVKSAESPGLLYAFQSFWHPFSRDLNNKTFYRRAFEVPQTYAGCSTYLSVDDTYELFLNGQWLASGKDDLIAKAREYPIRDRLHLGRNVIAISAINMGATMSVRCRTDLHLAYPVARHASPLWRCSRAFEPHWSELQPSGTERPETLYARSRREATRPGSPNPPRHGWSAPVLLNSDEAVHVNIDSTPMWIDRNWGPQEVVYFRMPLFIDGLPNFGNLRISADNGYEVWVNGKLMGQYRGEKPDVVADIDISTALHHGWNVIGVKALNWGGPASLTVLPTMKVSL